MTRKVRPQAFSAALAKARGGAGTREQHFNAVRFVVSDTRQFSLQHDIGMPQLTEGRIRLSICEKNRHSDRDGDNEECSKRAVHGFPFIIKRAGVLELLSLKRASRSGSDSLS